MKIDIKGLDQFTSWTDSIQRTVEANVKTLVNQTAYEIEADAKALAPVDTGNLRRSINTTFDIQNGGMSAEVGTNVEYAIHVEHGTSKQSAQPFLNPAFISGSQKFEDGMNKIVGDIK